MKVSEKDFQNAVKKNVEWTKKHGKPSATYTMIIEEYKKERGY